MSAAHTPGPWVWDSTVWDYDPKEDAPWLVTEASGDRVLSGEIKCPSEANAKLIAAAPDLLAVLQEIESFMGADFDDMPMSSKARAAITKATGATT